MILKCSKKEKAYIVEGLEEIIIWASLTSERPKAKFAKELIEKVKKL